MKTSKETIIAGVVTVMFFTALGFALFYSSDNTILNEGLKTEKLRSEKMLSQKLALDKDISKLKADITAYQSKNTQLDSKLSDMYTKLSQKENELNELMKQKNLSESKYKKQITELGNSKSHLQDEIAQLNESIVDLKFKNSYLQNTVASLEKSNSELNKQYTFMSDAGGNNFGIEALKKNQKLTINSKRTKEIVLGFDVPAAMAKNLTLTVTNPAGKSDNNISSAIVSYQIIDENDPIFMASTNISPDLSKGSKRVALSYKPTNKFQNGTYKIDIYHDKTYLGSSQIKLK